MRIKFLDLQEWAEESELELITNPDGVSKDKKMSKDGLYSETIFGRMYGDSALYTCNCGKMHGKFHLGVICDGCESVVEKKGSVIKKFGGIHFGEDNYLMNPFFYTLFEKKIFGKMIMDRIAGFEGKLDIDGNIEYEDGPVTEFSSFYNKGMEWISNNFTAIWAVAKDVALRKGQMDFVKLVEDNWDFIFLNFMPVFSHRLRPAILIGEKLTFDKINNHYLQLMTLSNSLQSIGEGRELNKIPLMFEMQKAMNLIHDRIIDTISGKTGYIRNSLIGNRLNFTSRTVIVPLEYGHDIDEVHIPYLSALELFKFHIMNVLVRTQGLSQVEALREWTKASTKFSRRIYEIIKSFVEAGSTVLINRNPSISIGSILFMRLTHVKEDITDLTMSLPNNILKLIGGDFDGDVLSIYLVLDEDYKVYFEKFNPKHLVLSPNDGHFNSFLALDKDHVLGLSTLTS
jgi:DNA-directed RNA polymerase beta' subunit